MSISLSTFSPANFLFISCCQSVSFVLALVFVLIVGLILGLAEGRARSFAEYTAKPIMITVIRAVIIWVLLIGQFSFRFSR